MANTHFVANLQTGLGTLTLKVFTRGTNTLINTGGDTAAEDGTRAGFYDWTVSENVTGIQDCVITNSGGVIIAWLQTPIQSADDTNTYVVEEISNARLSSGTGTGQVSLSSGQVILQSGTGTGQLDFTSGVVKTNVTQFGGSAGTFSSGRPEVNTTHWGGTAVASAYVQADMARISGDGTAADNAEAFFDGTGYAGTNNVIPLVTTTTTATNLTNLPAITAGWLTATGIADNAITAAKIADGAIDAATFAAGAITASAIASDAITDAKVASDVTIASVTGNVGGIAGTTQTLDALQTALNSDHGSGSWATATGFSTHSAADVWAVGTRTLSALDEDSTTLDLDATIRAAVGMASANLDTQLGDLPTDTELATALGTADDATLSAIAALSIPSANTIADAVLSRNVSNVESSMPEHCFGTIILLGLEAAVSGTTLLIKGTDGTTTRFTKTVSKTAGDEPIRGVS